MLKRSFLFYAVVMAIEDSSERSTERMVNLLQSLCSSNIITPDEMSKVRFSHPSVCPSGRVSALSPSERSTERMVNLLQSLCSSNIITPDEMSKVRLSRPSVCLSLPLPVCRSVSTP